jgi:hypothetical protein
VRGFQDIPGSQYGGTEGVPIPTVTGSERIAHDPVPGPVAISRSHGSGIGPVGLSDSLLPLHEVGLIHKSVTNAIPVSVVGACRGAPGYSKKSESGEEITHEAPRKWNVLINNQ